jgi:hypothetical protein
LAACDAGHCELVATDSKDRDGFPAEIRSEKKG